MYNKNSKQDVFRLDHIIHSDKLFHLLIRYGVSGLLVGIIYIFIGHILTSWGGLGTPISVIISYVITTPLAFTLHKNFTFKSDGDFSQELPRFISVGLILLILSSIVDSYITLPIPVQLLIYWFTGSFLNFLGYKFWVFTR